MAAQKLNDSTESRFCFAPFLSSKKLRIPAEKPGYEFMD